MLLQPYKERWHNRLKVFTELTIALTFLFSFQIKARGSSADTVDAQSPVIDLVMCTSITAIALTPLLGLLAIAARKVYGAYRARRASIGMSESMFAKVSEHLRSPKPEGGTVVMQNPLGQNLLGTQDDVGMGHGAMLF